MFMDEEELDVWLFFSSSRKTSCLWLVLHHSEDPNQWHYHHGNRVSPTPVWSSECTKRGAWGEWRRRLPVVITLPESHQVITQSQYRAKIFSVTTSSFLHKSYQLCTVLLKCVAFGMFAWTTVEVTKRRRVQTSSSCRRIEDRKCILLLT